MLESVEEAIVLGDARQLDRLVRNLVDNAVRYAVDEVAVRIEVRPGEVVLPTGGARATLVLSRPE